MALSNDMTTLLNKIERRLGLVTLGEFLPEHLKKPEWGKIIMEDSLVTFSRYFPQQFKMIINDDTCEKRLDRETNTMWYYIKDEVLKDTKLLGIKDIDWTDTSSANNSLTNGSVGTYYYPTSIACPAATYESIITLQTYADFASLYNRGIVIDFQYPNKFCLKGLGNTNYDLSTFVVVLLVEHKSLSTISPTKMNSFEKLCEADIALFLCNELKYFDGFNTAYIDIDLKLSELQDAAGRRNDIIELYENNYTTMANDSVPAIWTI